MKLWFIEVHYLRTRGSWDEYYAVKEETKESAVEKLKKGVALEDGIILVVFEIDTDKIWRLEKDACYPAERKS